MKSERKRVLVVEDDPDTRDVLIDLFHLLGHDIVVASTGHEAIETFVDLEPHVVFVDIELPDMNGHDVARWMRMMTRSDQPLTLVALTGWSRSQDCAASFAAGMDLHIVKPAGIIALRDVVGDASSNEDLPSDWPEGSSAWPSLVIGRVEH